jgi:hypothetical protein
MASLQESVICGLNMGCNSSTRNTIFGTGIGAGADRNSMIGYFAGCNVSAYGNTIIGSKAGCSLGSNTQQILIGDSAGTNIGFTSNVMIGRCAGFSSNRNGVGIGVCSLSGGYGTAYLSVAIGVLANPRRNTFNVSVGSPSAFGAFNAVRTVNLGFRAGDFAYGANATFIGARAGYTGGVANNTTEFGFNTYGGDGQNNCFMLGTYSGNNAYVYTGWSSVSDSRDKKNIENLPNNLGLNFIRKLRPVLFKYDFRTKYMFKCGFEYGQKDGSLKEQIVNYGFLAQQIEGVAKELNVKFDGVDYDKFNDKYEVKMLELISPIVKSIQDLNNELDIIEQQIG